MYVSTRSTQKPRPEKTNPNPNPTPPKPLPKQYEHNANGGKLNHVTWDANVRPYLDMTIKGVIYYQGENNAGTLHGNSALNAGYSCMMPQLLSLWRREWSKVPGTTDPNFPFGIVTLSTADSEGAADFGSFRWAQTASYGVVPNELMNNAWTAHAYDLADPCAQSPSPLFLPYPHHITADRSPRYPPTPPLRDQLRGQPTHKTGPQLRHVGP